MVYCPTYRTISYVNSSCIISYAFICYAFKLRKDILNGIKNYDYKNEVFIFLINLELPHVYMSCYYMYVVFICYGLWA